MLKQRNPQAARILAEVAEEFGMTVPVMLYHGQGAGKVSARRCAMRRMRDELGMSYPQIGHAVHLDHTTVMHHLRQDRALDTVAVSRHGHQRQLTLEEARKVIAQQARMLRELASQVETLSSQVEILGPGPVAPELTARKGKERRAFSSQGPGSWETPGPLVKWRG